MQDGGVACGAIALLPFGWRLGLWTDFGKGCVAEWYHLLGLVHGLQSAMELVLPIQIMKALSLRISVASCWKKGWQRIQWTIVCSKAYRSLEFKALRRLCKAEMIRNVWQSLKALGNSRPKPFLWHNYNELQDQIRAKGKSRWGADLDMAKRNLRRRCRTLRISLT